MDAKQRIPGGTARSRNMRQYLLATLYNALLTIGNCYPSK